MSMKYIIFYILKNVQYIILHHFEKLYGKDKVQAMIEFISSKSVISEQQYKHRLKYMGKHLFLQLKIACNHACILKIYDRQ